MNSKLRTRMRVSLIVFAGIILAACFITKRAQADSWDKMTLLTLNEPTQVSDTYLEPGTYMFKLANSDRHIVQVFNRDRSHLITTIMAIPAYRLEPTGETQLTFWETPPGSARAVRDWYYPGDDYGQEFTYPKDLRQIAAVTPPSLPAPALPPPVASVVTPEPPPAVLAPEPQALLEEQPAPQEQEPVEIAQNNPPPAPAPPVAQDQPQAQTPEAPAAESQSLPQTASPYPLIGLGGLLSLGLFLGLRVKQFR